MTTFGAMLDRAASPTAEDLAAACGSDRRRWDRLVTWIETTYGITGEPLYFGRDSGWVLRFRRSGKALLTLLPLAGGGLRALVIVGPSAWEAVADVDLSEPIRAAWTAAHPYPDGRWLWPVVDSDVVVEDIERLVALKSPPPRRPRRTEVRARAPRGLSGGTDMTSAVASSVRQLGRDDLYRASARMPELVQVPEFTFVMIDGHGDPNTSPDYKAAIEALYGLAYTLKFALKNELGLSYRVGALEGLWWADDMIDFTTERKANYRWTMIIAQPDVVTPDRFARAREEIGRRRALGALGSARLERFAEGLCAQVLHVGSYSAEGPTIARLHAYIQELGGRFDGHRQKHHEIYLGDPRRTAPEKWRTIIRQPIELA